MSNVEVEIEDLMGLLVLGEKFKGVLKVVCWYDISRLKMGVYLVKVKIKIKIYYIEIDW